MKPQRFPTINTSLPTSKSPNITPSNRDVSTEQSRSSFNHKRYMKPSLTEEEVKEIKQIFDVFDTEKRGLIDPKDMIDALNAVDYKGKQNTLYQQLLNMAADGQGEIQFGKLLTLLTTKVTEQDSRQDMLQLFSMLDDEKCGFITVKNLRRAIKELDIDVREEQLQRMVEIADADMDGRVSQEEFFAFMTAKQ